MQCVIWANIAWWLLASSLWLHTQQQLKYTINNLLRGTENETKTMSWWIFAVGYGEWGKLWYLLRARESFLIKKLRLISPAIKFNVKLFFALCLVLINIFLVPIRREQCCACSLVFHLELLLFLCLHVPTQLSADNFSHFAFWSELKKMENNF